MAELLVRGRQTVGDIGSGPGGLPLADRLGALGMTDRINMLIQSGYGWMTSLGSNITPIVGGGNGTIIDPEQSEMSWAVPAGIVMIPLRFHTEASRPLGAADADTSEVLYVVDTTTTLSTASAATGTVKTPTNMRTDLGTAGNPLTVVSANTSDHNTPTFSVELDRSFSKLDVQGTAATISWTTADLLYAPTFPPLLVGPCSVFVYFGGTVAHSGYGQYNWLALPALLSTALFGT